MTTEIEQLISLQAKIAATAGLVRTRDEMIASMLRCGRATAPQVMGWTGLSKARIYQIVKAKYPSQ